MYSIRRRCSRCKITTTEQATSVQGGVLGADGTPEPLSTLQTFRKFSHSNVYFGQNLVHVWPTFVQRYLQTLSFSRGMNEIRVGDAVQADPAPRKDDGVPPAHSHCSVLTLGRLHLYRCLRWPNQLGIESKRQRNKLWDTLPPIAQ